jgi:hypothetical protein
MASRALFQTVIRESLPQARDSVCSAFNSPHTGTPRPSVPPFPVSDTASGSPATASCQSRRDRANGGGSGSQAPDLGDRTGSIPARLQVLDKLAGRRLPAAARAGVDRGRGSALRCRRCSPGAPFARLDIFDGRGTLRACQAFPTHIVSYRNQRFWHAGLHHHSDIARRIGLSATTRAPSLAFAKRVCDHLHLWCFFAAACLHDFCVC